jgi:hypothetical protein
MCYYSIRTDKGKVYKGDCHRHFMAKSKGLVSKLKGAAVGAAIGLAALTAGVNKANATTISSFRDFCVTSGGRDVRMDTDYETYADNLMIRDKATGTDSIVSGDYHMGFIKYAPEGANVIGYADNLNSLAQEEPAAAGWMQGSYYSILGDGQRPDDVWIVHDGDKNGLGYFNDVTGQWVLGADDTLYKAQDILFGANQIRGDTSQLPIYTAAIGGSEILPHMIIDPIPEPATLGLLGLGAGLALRGRNRKSIESKVTESNK